MAKKQKVEIRIYIDGKLESTSTPELFIGAAYNDDHTQGISVGVISALDMLKAALFTGQSIGNALSKMNEHTFFPEGTLRSAFLSGFDTGVAKENIVSSLEKFKEVITEGEE